MKATYKGWAKPDDPIYKTGLVIGGRRLEPSSKPKPEMKRKAQPKPKKKT